MVRILTLILLIGSCWIAALPQDSHLREPASGIMLAHSAFAHGYRHGYEEGYHAGNIDINMGRTLRDRPEECHGLNKGYSLRFGVRPVFEKGFHAGLKAGYLDGYMGRTFRAINALRASALAYKEPLVAEPHVRYFDQGFLFGYNDGFDRGGADPSSPAELDVRLVSCKPPLSQTPNSSTANESYCEGYRRGFVLGHADGFTLRPASARMEASK
jgi:flagellar biosynthesis/type III secretory pathway protein FliH